MVFSTKTWVKLLYCLYLIFGIFWTLIYAICKASSDGHFAFLHFFFLGMPWFLSPVQCHKSPSIVHWALCPWDLIPAWRILRYQNQYWDIELLDIESNNISIRNVHGTNYMPGIALCISNKLTLKIPKMYIKALSPLLSRFPY